MKYYVEFTFELDGQQRYGTCTVEAENEDSILDAVQNRFSVHALDIKYFAETKYNCTLNHVAISER